MTLPSDSELVQGLRSGDCAAFEAVYRKYRDRVYGYLRRLSQSEASAEDAFQDTWLKLSGAAGALREDTVLDAWIFTVARNSLFSSLKKARWTTPLDVEADHTGTEPDPETQVTDQRTLSEVDRALGALPDDLREALILVVLEGLEQQAVAQMLKISHGALRQRLARARAALAEAVDRDKPTTPRRAPDRTSGVHAQVRVDASAPRHHSSVKEQVVDVD